jgi:hypothetical protein
LDPFANRTSNALSAKSPKLISVSFTMPVLYRTPK